MLANDFEFYLYGGSLSLANPDPEPIDNSGLRYKAVDYDNGDAAFAVGYAPYGLDGYGNLSTRNIAYGAAANVPSENLTFMFSGLRSPTWDQTKSGAVSLDSNASVVADTLISLDLSAPNEQDWRNYTLPESITGRASAELVWVPVGDKGILVALGGVAYPEFTTPNRQSLNKTGSVSSVFLRIAMLREACEP